MQMSLIYLDAPVTMTTGAMIDGDRFWENEEGQAAAEVRNGNTVSLFGTIPKF